MLLIAACATNDANTDQTTSSGPPPTAVTTTEPAGEQTDQADLEPGQCFDLRDMTDPEGAQTDAAFRVDCTLPHENQIYAILSHPAPSTDPYPGSDALDTFTTPGCLEGFEGFVGEQYELSELGFGVLRPTAASWDASDRAVYCFVYDRARNTLVGTAQDSGR
jgi:hypothetical protein